MLPAEDGLAVGAVLEGAGVEGEVLGAEEVADEAAPDDWSPSLFLSWLQAARASVVASIKPRISTRFMQIPPK